MKRTVAKRLLLGIFLLEAVVPAFLLVTTDPPRKFAWSMYANTPVPSVFRYVGVTPGNEKVMLDAAEVGSPWSSIHYGPETLRMLCERHAEVDSVIRYQDGRLERSERC
ncbi:hypothetical protein [Pseudonocardia acaciae]|uniref:hypothetical protein n=1 Tax=Pseudonocardia acaciae TaxID=551276 RepID=UPI00048F3039|nr:hypothetical protein [Pseudonocardia acaciae]